jgi:hypothetical protein
MNIPNAHAFLNICRCNSFTQSNNELGDLLNVDYILVLFVRALLALHRASRVDGGGGSSLDGVDADDLGAACDLERVLFIHALLVSRDVPEVGWGETGI